MNFYDREKELAALQKIEKLSASTAQMTVITGRRRIGKTTLIKKAFTGIPFVYFFVDKETGSTRLTEVVPSLGIEEEAGTIQIRDYLP